MIAAIYARKSTDQSNVADEQKSVARQIDNARAFAALKGWTVDDAQVFCDDGISGAEFANRPGFLRLMNSLKPRPTFQCLIMSEESRLGREAIETAYALKQIITAGVRVFFYLESRERTLGSATDKLLMSVTAFADELEREKARQRVSDAMLRKAKAGHNCGGRTFGYDNVDVPGPNGSRSHVVYRINQGEANVVRRIFDLAAMGEGLKAITKQLNIEQLVSPRPQQGRSRSWAPSSVREILHREMYRGRRVWNKTKKRDSWGQRHQADRPASDWLAVEDESLRIVSNAQWDAAHARMEGRRVAYQRWKRGEAGGQPNGKGVRGKYFLTGFGRCSTCGGSIQAVSRQSSNGRNFRYCCSTYWNRGASVCPNGRSLSMPLVDGAIHGLLRDEVLRPSVTERALDIAIERLARENNDVSRQRRLETRLEQLTHELRNLTDTAARGGAVPAILAALVRADEERRRVERELAAIQSQTVVDVSPRALRRQLRALVGDWSALLTDNVAEARPLLSLVLAGDRITFQPKDEGYELQVPVAVDRMLATLVPGLSRLQDEVASPNGTTTISRFSVNGSALRRAA
jgi:DNA invertase Pin-like site-specific DNA recombinase